VQLGDVGCTRTRRANAEHRQAHAAEEAHVRTAAAALIALACTTACSIIGVGAVPARPVAPVQCTDDYLLPAIDIGVAIAALAGTVAAYTDDELDRTETRVLAIPLIAIAAIAGVSAPIGYTEVSACGRVKRNERAVAERTRSRANRVNSSRDRAWELTKGAATAARAGDCSTAIATSPEVQSLDAEFHETVFAADAAIARCLGR
jgi:hypothetical protein